MKSGSRKKKIQQKVKTHAKTVVRVTSATEKRIEKILNPPRYKDRRLERWEALTEWPIAIAALAYLVAFAVPIIFPNLPYFWSDLMLKILGLVWLVFAIEYLGRFFLAKSKWSFVRYNLLDLFIVFLPFFGPLRLIRFVFLFRVLNRRAGNTLRGKITTYVVSAAFLVLLVGALALLSVERYAPGSQITNFIDAIWWSMATMTTVGYGDIVPVTTEGRIVAMALMLFGVALIGTVTASLASYLVEKISNDPKEATLESTNISQEPKQNQVNAVDTLIEHSGESPYASAIAHNVSAEISELSAKIDKLALQVKTLKTALDNLNKLSKQDQE